MHFVENHWKSEIKTRKCKFLNRRGDNFFSSISNSKNTIKKSNKLWDSDGSENYQLLLGLKIQLSNLWMAKQAAIYNHLLLCFQSHCITSTNLKVKYKIKRYPDWRAMTARENQEQLAMAGYASSYNITRTCCMEMIFTENKNWNKLRKYKTTMETN